MLIFTDRKTQTSMIEWMEYLSRVNPRQKERLERFLLSWAMPHNEMIVLSYSRWGEVTALAHKHNGIRENEHETCQQCEGTGLNTKLPWPSHDRRVRSLWIKCPRCNGERRASNGSYAVYKPVEVTLPSEYDFGVYNIYDESGTILPRSEWRMIYNGGLISHCKGNPRNTSWSSHT